MAPRTAGRKPDAGSGHSPMRPRFPRVAAVVVASAVAVHGCGEDSSSPAPRLGVGDGVPTVLATTGILADIVSNVACGGLAEIETIIPAGGDPHGFEPSLQDRARMEGADLIVANGLDLEEGLADTLAAVEEAGTAVFEFAAGMTTIPLGSASHDHGTEPEADEEGHGSGGDPHFWFDPDRVAETLPGLARVLTTEVGLDTAAAGACLADYLAELEAVDAETAAKVGQLPVERRKLVTNHDALGYFADRYGFKIIGTVIPSAATTAETNPAQLEELAETIEHEGVKAVFSETLHSSDDVHVLASRVGDVEVVPLYTGSLGPAGSGADTYIGLLRTNADLIVEALG